MPEMTPNPTLRPPDMVGAGAYPQPQDPASLIGLLRSQGSLPAEAMMSMMGPQPSTSPLASALLGGVAMMPGQTGAQQAVQLNQQQAQFQQQQQMQQAQLLQRARERREDLAIAKQKDLLTIYGSLLNSKNPDARVVGGRGMEQFLKTQGQPVPSGFAESFRQEELTLDKRKQAYYAILAAESDPSLQSTLPHYLATELNIPSSRHAQLIQEARSPAIHKVLFGKTQEEEVYERAKADRDERRYLLDRRKEDAREARDLAKEKKDNRMYDLALRREVRADAYLRIADAKLEYLQAKGPEEKRQKALDMADQFINQFDATVHSLDKTGGYLPTSGMSKLSPQYGQMILNRTLFPYDEDWKYLTTELRTRMTGYARSVQNDIGFRAYQAIEGAVSVMTDPPDIKSLENIITKMRQEIKIAREGKDTLMFVYIKTPDGTPEGIIKKVPWSRDLRIQQGDTVIKIE